MRATEYIHFLTRDNLNLGKNPKEHEYTHLTITQKIKRDRYDYQKSLRRKKHEENFGRF